MKNNNINRYLVYCICKYHVLLVTGITLPLISYGGSSLVVMMGSMGFLMSIANEC